MKRILILADMEGCCGIHDLSDETYCISCMAAEVDYIIHVLRRLIPCEITILDCHNDGRSLQAFCEMKQISLINHVWSLNSVKYDMAFLVGFHGMYGQAGVLSHTIRSDIVSMKLGDKYIGEVGLLTDWLAALGIPTVYISGDQSIKAELQDFTGVFLPVKGQEMGVLSLDDMKMAIQIAIEKAIINEASCHYREAPVRIKLIGETYEKHIPAECFEKEEGEVIFHNSGHLIQSLPLFCECLNCAEWFQQTRFAQLKQRLFQINQKRINQDKNAHEILSTKSWRSLTDEDFYYLTLLARRIEGH